MKCERKCRVQGMVEIGATSYLRGWHFSHMLTTIHIKYQTNLNQTGNRNDSAIWYQSTITWLGYTSETCLIRPPLERPPCLERPYSNFWRFLSTIGFHENWTSLEWPPVWKDHFFLTSRVGVPDKFHCKCNKIIHIQMVHGIVWDMNGIVCQRDIMVDKNY